MFECSSALTVQKKKKKKKKKFTSPKQEHSPVKWHLITNKAKHKTKTTQQLNASHGISTNTNLSLRRLLCKRADINTTITTHRSRRGKPHPAASVTVYIIACVCANIPRTNLMIALRALKAAESLGK